MQVVIDIDGDGSFMMNCQELATAAIEELDVKMVILNNQHLGMVVQWEDRFYKANRAHTYLGRRVRVLLTIILQVAWLRVRLVTYWQDEANAASWSHCFEFYAQSCSAPAQQAAALSQMPLKVVTACF